MSQRALTVSGLLPDNLKIDAAELAFRGEGSVGSTLLGFLGTKVQEALGSALDIDVLELIAEAWAKTDELREVAAGMHESGEVKHLFLAKHDVVCENRLNVVLEFAGAPTITDHLQLTLTAKFEGVGVTVDGHCIVAVDAGQGAAKAELRYSNTKLAGSTTEWVALAFKHTLAHPISIAANHAAKVVPLRDVVAA
jgi:hypothetical protein